MIEALEDSLPMAIGLALSPGPVIATIVILMTPRAKVNSISLLLGWFLGIYIIGTLVLVLPGMETNRGQPTTLAGIIRIILGILLLVLALRLWLKRPKSSDEISTPKFFSSIDKFGFGKSILTGLFFSIANVKCIALSAAGAARIDNALSNDYEIHMTLVTFALIGSITILIPIIIYFIAGNKVESTFQSWKEWLIKNNKVILMVILILISIILIKKGIEIINFNGAL